MDIVAVAIHEMGHALGFGSGIDRIDAAFGQAAAAGEPAPALDMNAVFSALDMFRYSSPGRMDLRPSADTFFSIDGGKTAVAGARFSTGAVSGDGNQAGHFRPLPKSCALSFEVMDPGRCGGDMGVVTGADLAAFDAIGWNLNIDPSSFAPTSTSDEASIAASYSIAAGASVFLPSRHSPNSCFGRTDRRLFWAFWSQT